MQREISCGLKVLFLVHAIVGTLFGLVYLIIPQAVETVFNVPIKEPEVYRLVGAAILGFAASSWYAWRESAWERVKIVVQMEVVWTILATLTLLWGLIFAGRSAVEWMDAIIMAGFAMAFSVFLMRHRSVGQ